MVSLYWMLPTLIVSSCIEEFVSLSERKASRPPLMYAEKCLKIYLDLYKGFQIYFVFVFGVSQLLSILTLFSCISQGIGSLINNDGLKFLRASGLFCISSGLILNITGVTFILDSAYNSMKGISKSVEDHLMYEKDTFEIQKMKNMIGDIQHIGQLSEKGFCEMTRGTLTGMGCIAIMFVIILCRSFQHFFAWNRIPLIILFTVIYSC